MEFHPLADHLRKRLQLPLPGHEAQIRMIPSDRAAKGLPREVPPNAKRSAVLLLLYPGQNGVQLPLILRNTYDGAHSAQVGLPGGQVDPSDVDESATALREAWEEIGIEPARVELIGKLTPLYIPVSNFHVQPFVGLLDHTPAFTPDPAEVAQLLPTPLADFHKPETLIVSNVTVGGNLRMEVPGFWLHERLIWGATAMIMSEFLDVTRR